MAEALRGGKRSLPRKVALRHAIDMSQGNHQRSHVLYTASKP
jgi:hypothetical protein